MANKDKLGKVLIVAGSADSMMTYQMQLSAYTTDTALNSEAATDLLDDLEPDVIIIDEKLPGTTGAELAQWIRTDQAAPHYYSILIVCQGKSRDFSELLDKSGADSACLYEQSKHDLAMRVDLLMKLKRSHDKANALSIKLNQSKETIRDLEDQDSITRLYNLPYITARLEKEIRHAERFHASLSFMIVSIEGFHSLVQSKGSLFMIKVLQQIGNDLIQITRADDIVGRSWSGDFYLILPETKPEGSDNLQQRIIAATSEKTYGIEAEVIKLELGFGTTSINSDAHANNSARQIIGQAEDNLKHTTLQKAAQKAIKIAN